MARIDPAKLSKLGQHLQHLAASNEAWLGLMGRTLATYEGDLARRGTPEWTGTAEEALALTLHEASVAIGAIAARLSDLASTVRFEYEKENIASWSTTRRPQQAPSSKDSAN